MMICNSFMFIIVSFLLVYVNGQVQRENNKDVCGKIVDVLCVERVFSNIVTAAKEIRTMTIDIEQKAWSQEPPKTTLAKKVRDEKSKLFPKFPSSEYHEKVMDMGNIVKHDLICLIKEEYVAVNYLYDFITSLREQRSTFREEIDNLLNTVQTILNERMICYYKTILRVYAEDWLKTHHTNDIQLSKTRKREMISLAFDSYSIIIAQLSRKWMEYIEDFINDLDNKIM